MERSSPAQMKPSRPVKSFGSCVLCGLKLCSAAGPQLLPCLHSLCKHCVSLLGEIKECPVCREKCELQDIISNLLFAELSTNPKEVVKCQGCEEPSVTGWCVECQEPLCTGCVAAHQRVKLAREHYVHAISPECPRPVICPIHKKELIYSYCLTCDRLICKLCRPLHPKHLLQYTHEALGKQRKQIQRMVKKAHQKRRTVQKNLQDLEGRLSDLEQLQAQMRLEVKETVVRLYNVMVKKAAKLNKEIKDLCGKEREKLAERRSLLQKLEEKLDHVLTFTDKTLASQHHTVLLSCKRQIHRQLQGMLDQVVSHTATIMDLSFHTNEDHVKKVLKTFGCVVVKEVPFACSNTGNVPNPSPDLLTPNHSLSAPTATFQNPTYPNSPSHSPPPTVTLSQQSPPSSKQHPVLSGLLSKKTSNLPTNVSFSSSQNNKYSNFPSLKRAWSYHPYYPKDTLLPAISSNKSISPQKKRREPLPFSKATSPKPPASLHFHTSAPRTSASIQQTGSSTTQTSHSQNSNGPSVGGHQNNVDLVQLVGQKLANLSPKPKETTFHHCEPPNDFGSDLQRNKFVKNGLSATVAVVGSCSVRSQAPNSNNASMSREVKGDHCNQPEDRSKGSEKRTPTCETTQTSIQTKPSVNEKIEPIEEGIAVANVKTSYSFLLKEEDVKDDKTFTKIRDDQGISRSTCHINSCRDLLPDVSVSRLPLPDFPSSSSTPAFRVVWGEEPKSFQIHAIKEEDQCPALDPITSNISRPLLVNKLHCAACRIRGNLFQCCMCQRAFHMECHLPPVSVSSGEQWQCMLCRDLPHSEDLDLSGGRLCLNVNDQKRCEYLLLYLSCNKQSSVLYRPVKLSSLTPRYVDMTLVRGRLLKKLTPYYLTPGEFVSDVWLLLHTLLSSSKEPQPVKRLKKSFSKELMRVFGHSLPPSLLKDPFTGQQEECGN
ncbi:transcription intermediary factor 1-beta-like [Salminus brasiliensis]|uniref:transcription intermediary factor 1-beta-like n=1 Tax=Salminus brasiliensis TaxID=930266 RepID=UPI003B834CEC